VAATEFEYRHQTLVHLIMVSIAFSTYFFDRDDITWELVRGLAHPHLWERLLFALATILIGVSTAMRTWARAQSELPGPAGASDLREGPYRYSAHPKQLGNFLFSIGLAFLAPLPGFVFLVIAEAIIFVRLARRESSLAGSDSNARQPLEADASIPGFNADWGKAIRQESAKWGLFLTMIVFTVLLQDGLAEILAVASLAVWAVLNCGSLRVLNSR